MWLGLSHHSADQEGAEESTTRICNRCKRQIWWFKNAARNTPTSTTHNTAIYYQQLLLKHNLQAETSPPSKT